MRTGIVGQRERTDVLWRLGLGSEFRMSVLYFWNLLL